MNSLTTIDALILETVTGGAQPAYMRVRPGKFFRERLQWAGAPDSYIAKRLGGSDYVPPAPYENCKLINRTLMSR
jgi:hypothetical protein